MRVEIESTNQKTGKKVAVVATFNERELAVSLFEALTNQRRPDGMSWQDAFAEIERQISVEEADSMRRAARAAMTYFAERVNLAGRTEQDVTQ